uniref:Prokaryotic-type class I peptide chain release factors domain-containing protein n=1 Tax=Noctiluca scintillans TaxID=2966 RepID=A0A7S1A018_NOCSC
MAQAIWGQQDLWQLHRMQSIFACGVRTITCANRMFERRRAITRTILGSGPSLEHGSCPLAQCRTHVDIPEKRITKKYSRSGGPGGSSVNMSDTRVQLSFHVNKADWIPEKIRLKMMEIHKNRISKKGELTLACQEKASTIQNEAIAFVRLQELIEAAEREVKNDDWVANEKLEFTDWVIEKKKREGREKDLEKRAEAIKDMKRRSREKTRNKKIDWR